MSAAAPPGASADVPPGTAPAPRRWLTGPHGRRLAPPPLTWFGRVILAFLRRELLEASRYRAAFLTRLFATALSALALYFFARFVDASSNQHLRPYGGDYLAFGLCGIVAAELQQIGVTSLSTRVRLAQLMGYLEAQLSTPAPAWIVLGAHPTYTLCAALCRSVLYVVAARYLFDLTFRPNFLTLAVGVPLSLLAFGGVGLVSAAATMVTRRTNPVGVILGGASALLSGVVYPSSVLPAWLADVGQALPLTHALEVLRKGLLAGADPDEVAGALFALGGFAVGFFILGLAVFSWALRRARQTGSLSHF